LATVPRTFGSSKATQHPLRWDGAYPRTAARPPAQSGAVQGRPAAFGAALPHLSTEEVFPAFRRSLNVVPKPVRIRRAAGYALAPQASATVVVPRALSANWGRRGRTLPAVGTATEAVPAAIRARVIPRGWWAGGPTTGRAGHPSSWLARLDGPKEDCSPPRAVFGLPRIVAGLRNSAPDHTPLDGSRQCRKPSSFQLARSPIGNTRHERVAGSAMRPRRPAAQMVRAALDKGFLELLEPPPYRPTLILAAGCPVASRLQHGRVVDVPLG